MQIDVQPAHHSAAAVHSLEEQLQLAAPLLLQLQLFLQHLAQLFGLGSLGGLGQLQTVPLTCRRGRKLDSYSKSLAVEAKLR